MSWKSDDRPSHSVSALWEGERKIEEQGTGEEEDEGAGEVSTGSRVRPGCSNPG